MQKSSFISLPKIRAVEKVEEKCFGSANVMQIISSEDSGQQETLYLDCKVHVHKGFQTNKRVSSIWSYPNSYSPTSYFL